MPRSFLVSFAFAILHALELHTEPRDIAPSDGVTGSAQVTVIEEGF